MVKSSRQWGAGMALKSGSEDHCGRSGYGYAARGRVGPDGDEDPCLLLTCGSA